MDNVGGWSKDSVTINFSQTCAVEPYSKCDGKTATPPPKENEEKFKIKGEAMTGQGHMS